MRLRSRPATTAFLACRAKSGQIQTVSPGNSYVIATQSCRAGQTESIKISQTGDFALNFFEDWNPASLGLYVTSC